MESDILPGVTFSHSNILISLQQRIWEISLCHNQICKYNTFFNITCNKKLTPEGHIRIQNLCLTVNYIIPVALFSRKHLITHFMKFNSLTNSQRPSRNDSSKITSWNGRYLRRMPRKMTGDCNCFNCFIALFLVIRSDCLRYIHIN